MPRYYATDYLLTTKASFLYNGDMWLSPPSPSSPSWHCQQYTHGITYLLRRCQKPRRHPCTSGVTIHGKLSGASRSGDNGQSS